MDADELTDAIALALANAKRVERESKIVVRDLARLRDAVKSQGHDGDQLQPGGTSTDE